ncbi:hypothetical protein E7Z53_17395 [Kocuria salina]|uniref:hypothetical protein n=1 Tax=Kocuria salina TaxID=1929416 RepID=UPI0015942D26|nr:hypothetical protein [Kocuria salina]NVC25200.1 hypothetical protein [Kocuria salina]
MDPETLTELTQHLSAFISALDLMAKTDGSAESICKMVEAQSSIESTLRQYKVTQPLRPTMSAHKAVTATLQRMQSLWTVYAEALSVSSMLDAQKLIHQGQLRIDECALDIEDYALAVSAASVYEDLSEPNLFERGIKALLVTHPNMSILDIGSKGAEEAKSLTGVEVDEGHGAQYLALQAVSKVHLDPENFEKLLIEAARLCRANERLLAVASQAGALESLAKSSRLLVESVFSFESVLQRENDSYALLRRIIKLYGEIFEDVAAPIFAWYCLLSGQKSQPYARLLEADATSLARSLAQNDATSRLFAGVANYLRNAAQHGSSFALNGDEVQFQLRSFAETLTQDQVINDVFAFLESLLATSWALSNALAQANVSILLDERDAAYMGVSKFRLACISLEQHGFELASAWEDSTSWTFELLGEPRDVHVLALALAHNSPDDVAVTVTSSPGDENLLVPFEAYTKYTHLMEQKSPPEDLLMGRLELLHACQFGSRTSLTSSALQFAAATYGLHVLGGDIGFMPYLRKTLNLAVSTGDLDVAEMCKTTFSVTRRGNLSKNLTLRMDFAKMISSNNAPDVPTAHNVIIVR